jgi:hypothetical protein
VQAHSDRVFIDIPLVLLVFVDSPPICAGARVPDQGNAADASVG